MSQLYETSVSSPTTRQNKNRFKALADKIRPPKPRHLLAKMGAVIVAGLAVVGGVKYEQARHTKQQEENIGRALGIEGFHAVGETLVDNPLTGKKVAEIITTTQPVSVTKDKNNNFTANLGYASLSRCSFPIFKVAYPYSSATAGSPDAVHLIYQTETVNPNGNTSDAIQQVHSIQVPNQTTAVSILQGIVNKNPGVC